MVKMKGFEFIWTILLLVCSTTVETRPQGHDLKKCFVDEIELQQDFDLYKV